MVILVDTDVLINGEKGIFDLRQWFAARENDRFEIAAITVAELWHGVERASAAHRVRRRQWLENLLARFFIAPYTEQTAYEHARLWAELDSAGKMIGYYDLIVAATALERNCAVATFNKRHFSQVKGLSLIEPR